MEQNFAQRFGNPANLTAAATSFLDHHHQPHDHHGGPLVVEATHRGRAIRILTTYDVRVDGKPVQVSAFDEDGLLGTHALPFHRFRSIVDLVRALIDEFPQAFTAKAGEGQP